MLLSGSNKQTKEKAITYLENLYRTELESEGYYGDEYFKDEIEYLQTCMK